MKPHLLLVLEGPLMAFGAVTVDAFGKIDDFPAKSMLIGVLCNALGYDRSDGDRLNSLQSRLVHGAAILRQGERFTDAQNAKLDKADKGWTTRGAPEGRAGGQPTYESRHRRFRDYVADGQVLVAIRLEPAEEAPTLNHLTSAVREPERPLFLGRKPCLPARPLLHGVIEASNVIDALTRGAAEFVGDEGVIEFRARWPTGEGQRPQARVVQVCEERDWVVGVHVGLSRMTEGLVRPAATR
jgi:CRISPR system Cascade subunit CasD